ncbi:hypothetical protein KCU90_g241, partial [Aureobasidium melanogenum]
MQNPGTLHAAPCACLLSFTFALISFDLPTLRRSLSVWLGPFTGFLISPSRQSECLLKLHGHCFEFAPYRHFLLACWKVFDFAYRYPHINVLHRICWRKYLLNAAKTIPPLEGRLLDMQKTKGELTPGNEDTKASATTGERSTDRTSRSSVMRPIHDVPCTRLNKECDWEFRWKFDDVTQNTQNKYSNVSITGNAVWDPQAPRTALNSRRSLSPAYDNLPSFADLTNDEDRERKAESQVPGTFNVVVNPESFAGLPEYGPIPGSRARGSSLQSGRNSWDSQMSTEVLRTRPKLNPTTGDPNVVVLAKFEDAPLSLPSLASFPIGRRTSLPENLHTLNISGGSRGSSTPSGRRNDSVAQGLRDERLMVHYRGFISKRIFPIGKNLLVDRPMQDDPIVAEARDFPPSVPLRSHHLDYINAPRLVQGAHTFDWLVELASAIMRDYISTTQYAQSLYSVWPSRLYPPVSPRRQICTPTDFYIYIFCYWYTTLAMRPKAQLSIAKDCRMGRCKHIFYGNGNGHFVQAFLTNELTMPNWNRIFAGHDIIQPAGRYHGEDTSAYADIFTFAHQVCIQGAKLCQVQLKLRAEATVQTLRGPQGSQVLAACTQVVTQLQSELYASWHRYCPSYLFQPNSEYTTGQLPLMARIFLDFAQLQFSTWVVYSNSSLYPTQPFHLTPSQRAETRLHSLKILSIADAAVALQNYDQHQLVFPVFIAGFANVDMETQSRAIELLRVMEGTGISRNATRSRELLSMVFDEQRARVMNGGRAEEVDWIDVSKATGMGVHHWPTVLTEHNSNERGFSHKTSKREILLKQHSDEASVPAKGSVDTKRWGSKALRVAVAYPPYSLLFLPKTSSAKIDQHVVYTLYQVSIAHASYQLPDPSFSSHAGCRKPSLGHAFLATNVRILFLSSNGIAWNVAFRATVARQLGIFVSGPLGGLRLLSENTIRLLQCSIAHENPMKSNTPELVRMASISDLWLMRCGSGAGVGTRYTDFEATLGNAVREHSR